MDRMLLNMWAEFSGWAKHFAAGKALKKYYTLRTELNIRRKHQEKQRYLNLKLGKNKIKMNHKRIWLQLFNSTSVTCRLGHHELWIRPLPSYRWLRNRSYTIILKLKYSLGYSTSRLTYWSHHLVDLLDPGMLSAPVHSSYMGRLVISSAMVTCRLWMYSLMVHSPSISKDSYTGGHYHVPSPAHQSIFLQLVWPSNDENPLEPSTLLLSPPIFQSHTTTPYSPPPCASSSVPTPLLLPSPVPSPPFPTTVITF